MKYITTTLLILIIVTTGIITSCSKNLKVKIPYEGDKLVLNSLITQDSFVYVRLSNTTKLRQSYFYYIPTGAAAQLFENGIFKENLVRRNIFGDTFFVSTAKARVSKTYTIKAQATNLTAVEGSDAMPVKAQFTPMRYKVNNNTTTVGNNSMVECKIRDNGATRNYYGISLFPVDTNLAATGPRLIIRYNNPEYITIRENTSGGGNPLFGTNEDNYVLISDETFNGRDVILNIEFFNSDMRNHIATRVTALSEAAYKYMLSVRTQINTQGNPLAEVAPIFNNITNGYGIVGCIADSTFIIRKQL